jgi:hypothetical protein
VAAVDVSVLMAAKASPSTVAAVAGSLVCVDESDLEDDGNYPPKLRCRFCHSNYCVGRIGIAVSR